MSSRYREKKGSSPKGKINLKHVSSVAILPNAAKPFTFGVVLPSRTYQLVATSDSEAQLWIEAIRAKISNLDSTKLAGSPGVQQGQAASTARVV